MGLYVQVDRGLPGNLVEQDGSNLTPQLTPLVVDGVRGASTERLVTVTGRVN